MSARRRAAVKAMKGRGRRGIRILGAVLTALLSSCDGARHTTLPCSPTLSGSGPFVPAHPHCIVTPVPTCAEVSVHAWPIEGPAVLALGESRLFTFARVDRGADPVSTCSAAIASVAWSTDQPAVVSVVVDPQSRSRAWVTGLTRGAAAVTARITFVAGSGREAVPATVSIGGAADGRSPQGPML
jgi:hypothetical protein